MKRFVSDATIKKVVEYFRERDYSKPEQIGLFLYFKAAGLNQFGYSEYKKWGEYDANEREGFIRTLYDLAGIFDGACENGLKYTALFPFSISNYYKTSSYYNGGTPFKMLGSRISDTLDNSLVSTIIQRDADDKNSLKFNDTYIEYIREKQLKGHRISLSQISAWVYRFWELDFPVESSNREITDALILGFLINYQISVAEFKGLFSFDSNTIDIADSQVSGPRLRELLVVNKGDCAPNVQQGIAVDYMPIKKQFGLVQFKEMLELRGPALSEQRIIEILTRRDEETTKRVALFEGKKNKSITFAWYVGATGNNDDGVYTDFSDQYIAEGRWENRYELKYTEVVKTMKVGDRIVIKSSYTKKNGLPFDNGGKTVGVMAIKATGIITRNHMDGKNIDVDWTRVEPIKEWFGDGVLRTTAHCVKASDGYIKKALLQFTFEGMPQDYSLFEQDVDEEDMCKMDEKKTLPTIGERTRNKFPLNSILYGAPGTGKTYSTAEYAMSIIENRELSESQRIDRKVLMTQYKQAVEAGRIVFTTFHQSYGYEDFIQGLRPDTSTGSMKFIPVDGVFKRIADKAMLHSDRDFVIIIDEINRANISKVFGELITLIEEDKRWGEINELSVTLPSGESFAIPNNLYILGTMNSADKSISLIDTALRRRFEFIEVVPNAELITDSTLRTVLERLNAGLVKELDSTDLLIGHAYFINKSSSDLCSIMNHCIIPLLYEYFFDNSKKVEKQVKEAVEGFNVEVKKGTVGRITLIDKVITNNA